MFQKSHPHFKAPFRYDPNLSGIVDANDTLFVDVRAWGYLTGPQRLSDDAAAAIQDQTGESIATLINKNWDTQ